MKYNWIPVPECDDDDGNPTVWAAEVNSQKYGKFALISDVGDEFEITSSNYSSFDCKPRMICKSLTSAKRWVSMNIR